MKTLIDKTHPNGAGLRLRVTQHDDDPEGYHVSLERDGLTESVLTADELRFVGCEISRPLPRSNHHDHAQP